MKQKIGRWQVRLENEINISKGDRSEVTGKIKEFITNDGKEINDGLNCIPDIRYNVENETITKIVLKNFFDKIKNPLDS